MRLLFGAIIALALGAGGARAQTDPLAAWAGVWRGRCELVPPYQGTARFDASLAIAAAAGGAYQWQLVYEASGSLPRQVRDYEMVPVDAAKGHFVLDEKNGLKLDAFAAGRAVYMYFMISGNRIPAHYELLSDGEMLMNLPTFDQAALRNTCLSASPAVCTDSFRLKMAQLCRLRRTR